MSIFDTVEKLITEHGSAKILGERLLLVKDQLKLLFDENVALKEELSSVKAKNAELNEKITAHSTSEEFVEYGMALFKRNGKGSYSNLVYCPRCKQAMSPAMFGVYRCSPCGQNSEVNNGSAQICIDELMRRDGALTKENPC